MKPKLKRWLCYCSGPAPPEKPVFGWQLNLCSVPSRRGATPDRDAVQAREHGSLTPAKLTRAFLTRALARGKRAGEIGLGGRPGGDGDRARAVGCARSNRSGRRISTSGVAFSRRIWSMGPSGLPGGPNTNVRSPMANQVHSMTLCAMRVVRGRRANGSDHSAAQVAALRSPTY